MASDLDTVLRLLARGEPRALLPDDGDITAVFVADAAAAARAAYRAVWAELRLQPLRGPATLRAELVDPGRYARVAPLLRPGLVWARCVVARAAGDELILDGFVRPRARWVWFPKPWRHLSPQACHQAHWAA